MKLIEPCCYIKQLNQWIGEDGDTSFLYHNGDVLLQYIYQWMVRRFNAYPGLDVTIAIPAVTPDFLSTVKAMRYGTGYDSARNLDYPVIRKLSLITRDANTLEDYTDIFDNIAVTKNLALQAVTLTNGKDKYVTLTGGLVQSISPGPHLIVITKTEDRYRLIQPLLDSHTRLHKIKI